MDVLVEAATDCWYFLHEDLPAVAWFANLDKSGHVGACAMSGAADSIPVATFSGYSTTRCCFTEGIKYSPVTG